MARFGFAILLVAIVASGCSGDGASSASEWSEVAEQIGATVGRHPTQGWKQC